jgi:hypothetical protein
MQATIKSFAPFADHFMVYKGHPDLDGMMEQAESKTCFSLCDADLDDSTVEVTFEEGMDHDLHTATLHVTAKGTDYTVSGMFYNSAKAAEFLAAIGADAASVGQK